jgi:hypothetical protein
MNVEMNFRVRKMLGNNRMALQLVASQAVLSITELVKIKENLNCV